MICPTPASCCMATAVPERWQTWTKRAQLLLAIEDFTKEPPTQEEVERAKRR